MAKQQENGVLSIEEDNEIINKQQQLKHLSLLSDFDVELFKAGKHYRLYEKLGARVIERNGETGIYFAVWAPNARYVSVVGNFNHWDRGSHKLSARWDGSGIWETFVPGLAK